MPDLSGTTIVVLGAGPTGLAVARLMAQRGVRTTVLERDAGPHARTQGGSLDLTEGRGLRAIEAMGLQSRFDEVARPEGQQGRILDSGARILVEMTAESMGTARPEIDRADLRRMLLDALPGGTVRWGHQVLAVRPSRTGHQVDVRTSDGARATLAADLVIACDGIWSRARSLVTGHVPEYIGITFVHGDIEGPDPDGYVSRLVRHGTAFAIGDGRSMGLQRHSDGTVRVYFMVQKPATDLPGRGAIADRGSIVAELHRTYATWAPELTGVIDAVTGDFEYWPIYTLPPRQIWHDHRGVTLVGDAAHVMPPFTGQGVNHGLLDAVELVEALTGDTHAGIDDAVAAYEKGMLPRAEAEALLANSDDEKMMSGVEAFLRAKDLDPLPVPRTASSVEATVGQAPANRQQAR
ncbi:FAD-dependent oxidoreductase [Mangrovihabitans endophyticus]|uniref:FAD-dependent oxidoreductase n=1 Tax=Mangrovihabitans endophyticus TaxID=1751298 RepID=A0A8J3BT87_9ACTN|nr:NAD(P)/FAD-dependent oxidoreductase [Mangrovihabitans endophyticus]GGK74968.1 FAD-dependent oxidoreductase [Mangrovihabitans endophyticus]